MSGGARCWCGATATARLYPLRRESFSRVWWVVSCDACGTEFLDPMPDADELARAYASSYYGSGRRKFVGPVAGAVGYFQDGRVRLLRRYVAPRRGVRVLDVGCGNGDFLRRARRRGFIVEGTELSEDSARRAAPHGDITVHVGDLASMPLKPGAYRAVTLWHVLEHVPDPLATLRRAHEALAPGGYLFVSLPNADSWQARFCGPHWFHRDPPRHLWHFSPRSLGRLLRESGFAPRKWWHWSFEQNPYGWLQGTLNKLGFPADRLYDVLKGQRRGERGIAAEVAAAVLLAGPAFALSVAEAIARRGGTITVAARRRT